MSVVRRVLLLLALLVVTGCGGGEPDAGPQPPAPGDGTTATEGEGAAEPVSFVVYLLHDGFVQPVARERPAPRGVAHGALDALIAGLTERERQLAFTTDVPATTTIERLTISDGVATVDLRPCPPLAQVVFTLTQFPSIEAVTGGCAEGRRLTRASFEDSTPAILVESPVADEIVSSPLRLSGSANTFEATFQVELIDRRGRVIAEDFVTATSGSGTRGTFEASLPFEADHPQGTIVVYEVSAEDGSRLHEVRIPVHLLS